jgi:hypothetical protein
MPEQLIRLYKDGQPVELAMTERDFFHKKTFRKGEHEFQTAAEAGYRLGDRYEDLSEYDGPKTKAAYTKEQEEKRAERAAPKDDEKPAPAEAKK